MRRRVGVPGFPPVDTGQRVRAAQFGGVRHGRLRAVLVGAGLLVLVATFNADPAKASGVDAAVKALGGAPFGKFLLIIAALGLAAYGAYGFVRSRHADM